MLRTPEKMFEDFNVHALQSCRAALQRGNAHSLFELMRPTESALAWSNNCRAKTFDGNPYCRATACSCWCCRTLHSLSRAASAHSWLGKDFRLTMFQLTSQWKMRARQTMSSARKKPSQTNKTWSDPTRQHSRPASSAASLEKHSHVNTAGGDPCDSEAC